MHKRRIGNVDLDSGEIFEHVNIVAFTPKRRNGFVEGWVAVSVVEINGLLATKRKELGGEGLSVLLYLIANMEVENRVMANKTILGRAIEMDPRAVRRAFAKLLDGNFIREDEPIQGVKTYVVSPEIAWKGAARNHVTALAEFRKDAK